MPGGAAPGGPITFAAPQGKSKWPGILMASFAAFGGFLFGYDTGYMYVPCPQVHLHAGLRN